ncbi:MAG: crotonyl-CoA carboxylase/reductase [Chloroflexi bacterium]|nr:crotonyl-CoA carboxylase/reductase [Chloroflexota bacterium]
MSAVAEIVPVGELPPPGIVPRLMHAATLRQDRYGQPRDAFAVEQVPVPSLGPRQVLVAVMAAGVNYDVVWAALGHPVDVIAAARRRGAAEDYHIGGSDGAGIVWAVGEEVTGVAPGDHVVLSCGVWDEAADDLEGPAGPMGSRSAGIWGYDIGFGSFAQFARVEQYQCYPKPPELSWEEASVYMLTGATAYRQLAGFPPHTVRPGDGVLVWGGAGGLGSMAIQITRALGGVPVAVVSDEAKSDFCRALGAAGVIDRRDFDHWGRLPDIDDGDALGEWMGGARAFGQALRAAMGGGGAPRIVFEHPGEATLPTSVYVCETGGMVVICGGTSGYNADVDLRYLWVRQKRLQGSHFANPEDCAALNGLVADGRVKPVLSRSFSFAEIGEAHQLMHENRHEPGNMAVRVGARGADA